MSDTARVRRQDTPNLRRVCASVWQIIELVVQQFDNVQDGVVFHIFQHSTAHQAEQIATLMWSIWKKAQTRIANNS